MDRLHGWRPVCALLVTAALCCGPGVASAQDELPGDPVKPELPVDPTTPEDPLDEDEETAPPLLKPPVTTPSPPPVVAPAASPAFAPPAPPAPLPVLAGVASRAAPAPPPLAITAAHVAASMCSTGRLAVLSAPRGTPVRDVLVGASRSELIRSFGGHDRVDAGAGDDCVDGGRGNDRLHGAAGRDVLIGDRGDDVLSGGPGTDLLLCGAGRDVAYAGPGDRTRSCERVRRVRR